ncbi:putative tRNA-dihydrouridine synthase [Gracilariopsis chorda]|uniref:tRNA-dihydrouridine synthase n=1 Tax=Gracilariopsis chorda TaxID=448386 RepID=A0A2V3IIN3_9FLOR|nr:putative tRNA-dihydrouridine synthase [Gracilariopsis chorda]|eukprot:PXF41954.1 putative tRNA-dihydrouridine synthase [Gracilariopsis chorda]
MLHASLFVQDRIRPRFYPSEFRSVQLYGTDAKQLSIATRRLLEEYNVGHVDLNFGCPAPKVLRRGGGAALLADISNVERVVSAVVAVADRFQVPVTAKMRLGFNGKLTYIRAASAMQRCGISAITLHSRTAEELYDRGVAKQGWYHIANLVQQMQVPVFGNGDVFCAQDCLDLLRVTGAAGVVVGRGCLGRPWLFADLFQAMRNGKVQLTVPPFEHVRQLLFEHVRESVEWITLDGVHEVRALRSLRKWYAWYLQGYVGIDDGVVAAMCRVDSLRELEEILWSVDAYAVDADRDLVVAERGKLGRE